MIKLTWTIFFFLRNMATKIKSRNSRMTGRGKLSLPEKLGHVCTQAEENQKTKEKYKQ